jgi:endogenous inhibitor of DNA gyrase (YacG/DUF329 family)
MTPNVDAAAPQAAPCLICGKPATQAHRPFCSVRCRNIDLGRWLKGNYRIETDDTSEEGPTDER